MSDQKAPQTPQAPPAPPKPKEFSMTTEEHDLVRNQANLRSQHEYIATLIERDTFIFLNTNIRKRLGIDREQQMTYDADAGKVFVFLKPEPKKEPDPKKN